MYKRKLKKVYFQSNMCHTSPSTTRLCSQGHYLSTWPLTAAFPQCFCKDFGHYLSLWNQAIDAKRCCFRGNGTATFRSTRLIRLSSSAPGKCSIILLDWFCRVKKQEWNKIQIACNFTPNWWLLNKPTSEPSQVLSRLAFHKLEQPFVTLTITCEAPLHCEPWLFTSRPFQDPEHIYIGSFFPPSKTEGKVTIFPVIMLSFLSARLCVAAAVVFI